MEDYILMDPDEMIMVIINLHDHLQEFRDKNGIFAFPLGLVNEKQMVEYKIIVKSVLNSLHILGYFDEKTR